MSEIEKSADGSLAIPSPIMIYRASIIGPPTETADKFGLQGADYQGI
jgi:hypothetical protein